LKSTGKALSYANTVTHIPNLAILNRKAHTFFVNSPRFDSWFDLGRVSLQILGLFFGGPFSYFQGQPGGQLSSDCFLADPFSFVFFFFFQTL